MHAHKKRSNIRFQLAQAVLAVLLAALSGLGRAHADDTTPPAPAPTPTAGQRLPVRPNQVRSGVAPDIPEGYMLVEGDIQIAIADFDRRYPQGGPIAPDGTYETNLWPNGIVPFEFDANVSAANRATAVQAMNQWVHISNVNFQQCANNACSGAYVHIQASQNVNSSFVGRQGGRQVINIVSWGWLFVVVHELGHALGLEHEQSCYDRDNYVQINYANICKATDPWCLGGFCFDNQGHRIDCDFNFDRRPGAQVYGPYDFDSVMHYGRDDFSRNGNDTITVLPPFQGWQDLIGQRTHLSVPDKNVMACMYPRPAWRWLSATGSSSAGSCRFPYTSMSSAVNGTPAGGELWIEPGTYPTVGMYTKAMTLRAPNGPIVIGR